MYQEAIPGRTVYKYDVWPNVNEISKKTTTHLPVKEKTVIEKLLHDFTGVCNVNYKLRRSTSNMVIFEVNVRLGQDIADASPSQSEKLFQVAHKYAS